MSADRAKLPEFLRSFGVFILGGLLGGLVVYNCDKFFNGPIDFYLEKRAAFEKRVWPLLQCAHPHRSFQDLALKDGIEDQLVRLGKEKDVTISLYTKSFPDALWYGFNENEAFQMGSLFKVISLVNYLKQSESDPKILDQKITFNEPSLLQYYEVQGVVPKRKLELGKTYSIRELLQLMIIYSDNVASILLERLDQKATFKKLAVDLDVPIYDESPPFRPNTVHEFSTFFSILFNASYLSKPDSEYALDLLTRIEYAGGIRAGVPAEVAVAHKFGESLKGGFHYFNDCGIVYRPQHPFLICLSLKSKNENGLESLATDIAKLVYKTYSSADLATP
jgi:beta-lactamase class A